MSIGAYEQRALYVWPDNSWCEPEEYDELDILPTNEFGGF
jgi:hypothetical protein